MFYFLSPILIYNGILIAAAVIPAIFLMIKVYRSDRLEKEDPALLRGLVTKGILSSLLALVEEKVLSLILGALVPQGTLLFNILLYFVVVACSEESSKYIFLKKNTWKNVNFNCQFDGVVYAVFVALGFALWENISYVMSYGLSTALVRAVTAIPGHACFGVFMGVFYGIAKRYENAGDLSRSSMMRGLSILVPVLLHGAYDYIASMEQINSGWYFIGFVAVLFAVSYALIVKASRMDTYIE